MRKTLALFLAVAAFSACDKKPQTEEKKPSDQPGEPGAPAPGDTKAAEPGEPDAISGFLEVAIKARGGIEKLGAAPGIAASVKGKYMGAPYTSKVFSRPGDTRMDIKMADPATPAMAMAMGIERCWSQSGPVVMPCARGDAEMYSLWMILDKAAWLLPLKDRDTWDLALAEDEIGGKKMDALTVKRKGEDRSGVLFFDKETNLLRRVKCKGTLMGRPGDMVMDITEYKDLNGLKFPGKSVSAFADKPYVDEEYTDIKIQTVEDSVFEQPAQVADGTMLEKKIPKTLAACKQMKGAYSGIPKAVEELTKGLQEKGMQPMGAPIFVYTKTGPKNTEKDWMTDVCFPVGAPPKKPVKGPFVVKPLPPAKVLSVFGLGDYTVKSSELAQKLMAELKKKKKKPAGPMRQVTYGEPGAPHEQLVSEMQQPVK